MMKCTGRRLVPPPYIVDVLDESDMYWSATSSRQLILCFRCIALQTSDYCITKYRHELNWRASWSRTSSIIVLVAKSRESRVVKHVPRCYSMECRKLLFIIKMQ
jgi:hypothetical protein